MKKSGLFFFLFVFWGFAHAAPVDQQKARLIAAQFMQDKGAMLSGEPMRAPGRVDSKTSVQPLYVFNAAEDKGFVIVSGDDCAEPILGYTDKGHYDEEEMPDNFRDWITSTAKEIEMMSLALEYEPTSSNFPLKMPVHNAIPPLIKTQWGQGTSSETGFIYNTQCPKINGKYAYAGCVAVAGAQIMYYYQHPKGQTAAVSGYSSNCSVTSEGLPATTFSWDDMKATYGNADVGTDSEKAVAELILYCGYAAQMKYDTLGSAANVSTFASRMTNFFDYDKTAYKAVVRSDYTVVGWDQFIYNELEQKRPIIYIGSAYNSSHAFICDGYDGNGFYHFNWGWGGNYDGYFKLHSANPFEGDGTQRYGYCLSQFALTGLKPNSAESSTNGNSGEDEWEEKTIDGIVGTVSNVDVNGTVVSMRVSNCNSQEYGFGFGLGEIDSNGKITVIDTKYEYLKNTILQSNYGFSNRTFDLSSYNLSKGKHMLVPICLLKGESNWSLCKPAETYFEVDVTATGVNNIVLHPLEKITVNEFDVDGKGTPGNSLSVNVKVTNEGDNYAGYLSLYVSSSTGYGSRKDLEVLKVKSGNSKEYLMPFTPTEEGTYTLYLCLGKNTENVLASTIVEAVSPKLTITSFSVPECRYAMFSQKVVATVKSTGNEYKSPLYLFASTTSTKGSFKYVNGTAIESGGSEDVVFYFKPTTSGTWNIWICKDSKGSNVVGQTTVTIDAVPTEDFKLTFMSGGYVGEGYYKAVLKNSGNVNFCRYIRSWVMDTSASSQIYTPSKNVFIESGTTEEVLFNYPLLQPGHTYRIVLNVPTGYEEKWKYLAAFFFTVPPEIPGDANNDGEVTVEDIHCIVEYILGSQSGQINKTNADLNCDGIIDVSDLMAVVSIIVGQ